MSILVKSLLVGYSSIISSIYKHRATNGSRCSQIALDAGADDIGSTMMEENVAFASGDNESIG